MDLLKQLRIKSEYYEYYDYPSDVERIVRIFADRGYQISPQDAHRAWRAFSDSMAAGWLILGDDDQVFVDIFYYFDEVE